MNEKTNARGEERPVGEARRLPAVLVVDDEADLRELVALTLVRLGLDVDTADSLAQARERLAHGRYALCLTDMRLPDGTGLDLVREVAQGNGPPIAVITAFGSAENAVAALKAGAFDYLTKPVDLEQLRLLVRSALREEPQIVAQRPAVAGTDGAVSRLLGETPAMRQLRAMIERVARSMAPVAILGESGSGKELVARAIHAASARRDRPLIKLNCAALPRELVESELFGHEKGAFTGAIAQRRGRFELADGGTLFLDEIGELPLESQAKLLRVLQDGEFERVGGTRSLRADVRVLAATNRDLHAEVGAGRFRADLYYRLNVFPIALPPLRERRDDIPRLLAHFAARTARRLGRAIDGIAPAFVERATAYAWPGNVRELQNVVERALILWRGGALDGSALLAAHTAPPSTTPAGAATTLEDLERRHIHEVLRATNWRIEGERGAARILGLNPSTLRGRMRKLGVRKND